MIGSTSCTPTLLGPARRQNELIRESVDPALRVALLAVQARSLDLEVRHLGQTERLARYMIGARPDRADRTQLVPSCASPPIHRLGGTPPLPGVDSSDRCGRDVRRPALTSTGASMGYRYWALGPDDSVVHRREAPEAKHSRSIR
jgi:hypothetical protein